MPLIATLLTGLLAALHLYILLLEMLLWTHPLGLRTFGNSLEQAQRTRVLAANQGLYNGFLAAGLGWAALTARVDIAVFFLGCVLLAGLYGGYSVNRRIVLVQGMPAGLALLLLWLGL